MRDLDWKVVHGESEAVLRGMEEMSVDAIVTDPPYELGFMGKRWDASGIAYSVELWEQALRVLKPGGHLLSFGGTRTYHRMACAVEDAGFEIRDCIAWMYGTGFPKSRNLKDEHGQPTGWGTALKPAFEPVVFARRPLEGTVAKNVEEHGTGAINIEGCRNGDTVETWPASRSYAPYAPGQIQPGGVGNTQQTGKAPNGRWPANVLLDEKAGYALDEQTGTETSRFFYVAKASRREREAGLPRYCAVCGRRASWGCGHDKLARANTHPTVKPVALMRYLCRLVTPPGGFVLDPFCGSGTTGIAALSEGFRFIGIEREAEYVEIARQRIAHAVTEGKASE